ncbi:MAG: class I SAM-dependent methyltransferase [Kofleriaceae bacterium]
MTSEDRELLEHYIERGAQPWNVSVEAAWLDYELRSFVLAQLPARRPLAVCNVGIGVGLFDDWLGHVVGAPITSVDRDAEIGRLFALRQRRERHPHPAMVICGDVCDGALGRRRFDVITAVGSTVAEHDDPARFKRALSAALAPGGILLCAEAGEGAAADRVRTHGDTWLACSTVQR